MQENDKTPINTVEEEGFDIKKLFSYALAYWKVFALSVVLCLVAAFFYLRYAVPQYQVTAKILLQDKERGSFASQADMLADFGFQSQNTNVENEIEVMKSMSVMRGAVADAGLYVSYSIPGFKGMPIYRNSSPLNVVYGVDSNGNSSSDSLANLELPITMLFAIGEDGTVDVKYECLLTKLDKEPTEFTDKFSTSTHIVKTPHGNVLVEKMYDEENFDEDTEFPIELQVDIVPLESAARSYMAALGVAPVSKMSSVSVMAINTPVPASGIDLLNAVIDNYNYVTNEEKRIIARQTEEFIVERIDSLSKELKVMETRLSNYKKDNQLISPEIDATVVSKNKTEYTKQLEEIDLMLQSSKFLSDFVNNPENDMKVIPTTFGLTVDPSLVAIINNYNQEVLRYNQLVLSAKGENPALKRSEVRVSQMQSDLRIAIKAFDRSLNMQREAVATLLDGYTARYEQSPDIERELMTIERECKIKSELYVMLLQKYEENALSLAISSNNLRCIDTPMLQGKVAPNSKMVMLVALFLGLVIPALFVYIRESMRVNISVNDDMSTLTTIPVVGTIPVAHNAKKQSSSIVVVRNRNDIMGEAFRTLRTNLQFVMKNSTGKVVMFTSTTSGEGKTFVASNLAMSVAMLGKKVLLIGLDIRRPRLAEMFGFDKDAEGITSYLAADESNTAMLDRFVVPSGFEENLYILPAGIVPPNPAELLSRTNLDKAIEYLSGKFDYIVLDTAPVALVTDSMIIRRVADALVYVARYDYTHKSDIKYLNSLVAEGKLSSVSLLLNGEDTSKKMLGYVSERRGSNKYVGYGYGNDGKKKKK